MLALSPDEKTLYASNWSSNDISAITLSSGKTRRYPTVRTPRALFPARDGRSFYVAGYENGEIARLDLRTGRQRTLLRPGGAMRHLVGDPERERLYAVDMGRSTAYVVDLKSTEVRELAETDRMPNTIDLSPDGRVLYVSNRGRNGRTYLRKGPEWGSVIMIDTRTGKHLDAVVGGNQTTGLDVSPGGTRLAFSDFLDSRVTTSRRTTCWRTGRAATGRRTAGSCASRVRRRGPRASEVPDRGAPTGRLSAPGPAAPGR